KSLRSSRVSRMPSSSSPKSDSSLPSKISCLYFPLKKHFTSSRIIPASCRISRLESLMPGLRANSGLKISQKHSSIRFQFLNYLDQGFWKLNEEATMLYAGDSWTVEEPHPIFFQSHRNLHPKV